MGFALDTVVPWGRILGSDDVTTHLADLGFKARSRRVSYEFQRGGNEMLIVGSAHDD